MIGDGWTDEPAVRPAGPEEHAPSVRRVAVITGSRAEFGLLRPVMRAIERHPQLALLTIAAGSHLVPPAQTFHEIKAEFAIADSIPMQVAGRTARTDDVEALGRGIARFGRSFERLSPDWVVILGDRIEAFAAAAAGSVGGFAVAHIHGGDRAEGVADEAMRHAITKLAHLHLAATEQSADRIRRMGELPELVHTVGSPAIDDLATIPPLDDEADARLGRPRAVFLMHPVGRTAEREEQTASLALEALLDWDRDARVVALHPNLDPGREGILNAIESALPRARERLRVVPHLPRCQFVGLLRRIGTRKGVLVGNSSASLIEAAALRIPAVDIGPRQSGREHAANIIHASGQHHQELLRAITQTAALDLADLQHPYGDGRAGERIAALLASTSPHNPRLLRKHCTY